MTTDMLRLLRNICGTPDDHGYVPVCHSHNPVILFSFMTYQRICNENNTTGATSGAETSQPFRRTWTHPWFLVYKTIICFWWPVLATIVNLLVLFFACSSSIYRFTELTTPFTVQDKLKIYIFKKRDREHRKDYSSVKASNSRVLLSRIRPCQWPMCNT